MTALKGYAYNQGLLSLYNREIAREKELKQPNLKVITALEEEIENLKL